MMKLRKSKCVYVIQNIEIGIIKIGVADDINSRMSNLRFSAGMDLVLVYATLPIYNYLEIEKKTHNEFKEERKLGEWFRSDPKEVVDYLKILIMRGELIVDGVFKKYLEEPNISMLSRQYGMSRAGVKKHLEKFTGVAQFDAEEWDNALEEDGVKLTIKDTIQDVPKGSKKVSSNIYDSNGSYYVKRWKSGRFIVKQFKDIDSAKQFLNKLVNN